MNNSNVTELKIHNGDDIKIPFYEKRWFKLCRPIVTMFINIPPIRKYISRTNVGMVSRIRKFYKGEKYVEALSLAYIGLSGTRKKKDLVGHYYWWTFMSYAVYSACMLEDNSLVEKLMAVAEDGFKPFAGSGVSYCFCRFSNFMFRQGDFISAIDFAKRANIADDRSGEPYYLLGWYELFINQNDPVEYFRSAVKRDTDFLPKIIQNPALREFPHIIQKIQNLRIVGNKS